jgi:hypothetical protein
MGSFEHNGITISSVPLFVLTCVATAVNLIVLSINHILGGKAVRGKYPVCFIICKLLLVPLAGAIWAQLHTDFSWKIVVFMVGSWMGDTLLLSNTRASKFQWFLSFIGAWSFLTAHSCMIWYFNVKWGEVPVFAYIFVIPLAIAAATLIPKMKFRRVADQFIVLYYLVLQFALLCSIGRLCQYPISHPSFLLCAAGYVFFLTSDTFLVRKEFDVDDNPRRLEIMGAYGLGLVLTLLGVSFSGWLPSTK